jgi:hypothetical protein
MLKMRKEKLLQFAILVLYESETWPFTQREDLLFYENRVLRRIFGTEREEVAGEWRRLRNVGLYGLYPSPDIIRVIKLRSMRWGECKTHGRNEKWLQNFGRKT